MRWVSSSCFNRHRKDAAEVGFVCACVCLPEPPSPWTCLPRVNWNNRRAESETEPAGIQYDCVSTRPSKQMRVYLSLCLASLFLPPPASLPSSSGASEESVESWMDSSTPPQKQRFLWLAATFTPNLHTSAPRQPVALDLVSPWWSLQPQISNSTVILLTLFAPLLLVKALTGPLIHSWSRRIFIGKLEGITLEMCWFCFICVVHTHTLLHVLYTHMYSNK